MAGAEVDGYLSQNKMQWSVRTWKLSLWADVDMVNRGPREKRSRGDSGGELDVKRRGQC